MKRTYGQLSFSASNNVWVMAGIPPHVAIRLKQLFPRIPKHRVLSFTFDNTDFICADLKWFMERYPLTMSGADRNLLQESVARFNADQAELERIMIGDYSPGDFAGLREGQCVRPYQAQAVEVVYRSQTLVLGDDLGLGKTYSAAGLMLRPGALPAAVVVQTHLPAQWEEKITQFTTLRVHKIKKTSPYDLPSADVYVFRYTQLAGWSDIFATGFFKCCVYDEVQELRRGTESQKGCGAQVLSQHTNFRLGLSATPIYGYGAEMWNIYNCLGSDVLGTKDDFKREWIGSDDKTISDPDALGSYLREQHVFMRRTKRDVGQQMPPVNVIVETVSSDGDAMHRVEDLAKLLATRAITGSFVQRGQASRELDMLIRQATGIGKAPHVAAYVRILLEAETPVILCGWHREVYSIWLKELAEFNPVMYTGSESPAQKLAAERAFKEGDSNLFILSLRSGAGLDGLQHRCSTVVFGELDWSKKIHEQIIGRVDREGQQDQVLAIYLNSLDGSDPPILDVLALKESQSMRIIDPGKPFEASHSDISRVQALAKACLGNREYARLQNQQKFKVSEEITT